MTKRADSPDRTPPPPNSSATLGPPEALGSRRPSAEIAGATVSRSPQSRSKALGDAAATGGSPVFRGFGRREALVLAVAAGRERGVPADWILARDRSTRVALARQLAMAAARRLGYSLPAIGEAFGRDHTTVLHADRAIATLASRDPEIATALEHIATSAADELQAPAREPDAPNVPARPVSSPSSPARRPPPRRRSRPRPRAPEFLGAYQTVHRRRRRLLLATVDGGRQLLDCAPGDLRVVQHFTSGENLLQIAAVAREYLQHARDEGRPLVARQPRAPA
jgi:Bacterial dnaA protein helix-turn-helix